MSEYPPLVSVVIPTYNRPDFLSRALESILAQEYDAIEVIVVDDCPSNPAMEVVESYSDNYIRYIQHDENQGVCGARNTGIQMATGEYVAFLDDDDEWDEAKLRRQVEVVESYEDIGVVYTGTRQVDNSGTTLSVNRPKYQGSVGKHLLLNDFVPFSTILVDRNVIDQTGLLDEHLTNWEDWEWSIRLAEETNFDFVKEPMAVTDRGAHEKRSDNFERKRDVGFNRFVEKVQPVAAKYGAVFERKWKANVTYQLGYSALSNGYYSDARRQLWKATRYWPFARKFYIYLSIAATGKRGYRTAQSAKRWVSRKIN